MDITNWVDEQKEKYPEANTEILKFIGKTASWNTDKDTEYKNTPECFFSSGYCYYFAVMLQHLFEGELMWHKFHSHIVFTDKNNVSYDAHGVFDDYADGELLPLDLLSDTDLKLFRHIGEFSEQEVKEGNLETAMNVLEYEIMYGASQNNIEISQNMVNKMLDKLNSNIARVNTMETNR